MPQGEEFTARFSVTDANGLPVPAFSHPIVFEDSKGIEGLPASVRFPNGAYTMEIPGLKAVGPDVAMVHARVEGTGHPQRDPAVVSNPAWIQDDPTHRLFWGDIHVHTRYSNCSGWRCLDPQWCYEYARDISFLDFAAAADHLRGIASDKTRWPRLQELAASFNDPGRFVAFLAFESSHAQGYGGDNNVYYLDDDAPYFWVDREDMRGISPEVHLRELWAQLDKNGKPFFTVPHHTGRAGKFRAWDEDYYDPQREPLFEIYSSWGSSEMRWTRLPISGGNNDAPSYFTDALRAGTRFGVIASSDDHATLPGSSHHFRVDPFSVPTLTGFAQKGLAALRAPQLTRPTLFEALTRRQTYATTHSRTLLEVTLNSVPTGSELPADQELRKRRHIHVQCTLDNANRATVFLVRNGEPLASQSFRDCAAEIIDVEFDDTDDLNDVVLRGAPFHPGAFAVYYVRIEDNKGGHQWSSPIWVDLA